MMVRGAKDGIAFLRRQLGRLDLEAPFSQQVRMVADIIRRVAEDVGGDSPSAEDFIVYLDAKSRNFPSNFTQEERKKIFAIFAMTACCQEVSLASVLPIGEGSRRTQLGNFYAVMSNIVVRLKDKKQNIEKIAYDGMIKIVSLMMENAKKEVKAELLKEAEEALKEASNAVPDLLADNSGAYDYFYSQLVIAVQKVNEVLSPAAAASPRPSSFEEVASPAPARSLASSASSSSPASSAPVVSTSADTRQTAVDLPKEASRHARFEEIVPFPLEERVPPSVPRWTAQSASVTTKLDTEKEHKHKHKHHRKDRATERPAGSPLIRK